MKSVSKRNFKIVGLYIAGMLLLLIYYQIDQSAEIGRILKASGNRGADSEFGMYSFVGIIKYGCMMSGALIIVITTMKLSQLLIGTK